MVVVDKLRKVAHFIHIKSTYNIVQIVDISMKEIFRLHAMSKAIIYDRDTTFTCMFWKALFSGSGTQIQFSTTYHPQTDG